MHAEHADSDGLNDLSGAVIGCAFTVLNTAGVGFLKKVYENALHMTCAPRAWGLHSNVVSEGTIMTWWSASTSWSCLVDGDPLAALNTVKAPDDAFRMPPIAPDRPARG